MLIASGIGERLREERDRLALNQTDFGLAAGVSRGTQKAYELETSSPDIRYLSTLQGMGVDVHFVLTGAKVQADAGSLNADEAEIVGWYRAMPDSDRAAVRRLTSALAASADSNKD